jgi:hypothetical protein
MIAQLEKERAAHSPGKVIYTAKIHTVGGRENGASHSSDGRLEVKRRESYVRTRKSQRATWTCPSAWCEPNVEMKSRDVMSRGSG